MTFGHFTAQGLYGTRDKRVPTAFFGTVFNDPRSGTVETQGYGDLLYPRELSNRWQLGSRVYFDRYRYDGDYAFDHADGGARPGVLNKDFARGNWWGSEVKLTKRFARRHTLAFGSGYRNNLRQDQFNYDVDPFFQYRTTAGHRRPGLGAVAGAGRTQDPQHHASRVAGMSWPWPLTDDRGSRRRIPRVPTSFSWT